MAIFSQNMAQKWPKLAENSDFDPKITKNGLKIKSLGFSTGNLRFLGPTRYVDFDNNLKN